MSYVVAFFFARFFFFFFKQKTAYEMLRSLVGSEMCIRDRIIIKQNSQVIEESENLFLVFYEPIKEILRFSLCRLSSLFHLIFSIIRRWIFLYPSLNYCIVYFLEFPDFFWIYWNFHPVSYTHLTLPTKRIV